MVRTLDDPPRWIDDLWIPLRLPVLTLTAEDARGFTSLIAAEEAGRRLRVGFEVVAVTTATEVVRRGP